MTAKTIKDEESYSLNTLANWARRVFIPDFLYFFIEELFASGVLGTGDNTIIYTSPTTIGRYDTFIFQQTQASASVSVQVKATPDDTAWSDDISIIDLHASNPGGARITTTTAGNTKRYAVVGKFYQLRVLQNGATAANIEGRHSIGNGSL